MVGAVISILAPALPVLNVKWFEEVWITCPFVNVCTPLIVCGPVVNTNEASAPTSGIV